jgi:hypothetical protein
VDDLSREFHPYRAWSLFILETWLRSHPARLAQAEPVQEGAPLALEPIPRRRMPEAALRLRSAIGRLYRSGQRALAGRQ